jgi:integrase
MVFADFLVSDWFRGSSGRVAARLWIVVSGEWVVVLLKKWLAVYCDRRRTLRPSTVAVYRSHIGSLCRWYLATRGVSLETSGLSLDVVEDFLATMRTTENWAPRTQNTCRSSINAVWNGAIRARLAAETNNRLVASSAVPQRMPIAWSIDDLKRLVEFAGALRGRRKNQFATRRREFWQSLYLFLYETASRFSAALLLRPGDIDFARNVVKLRAENSKTGADHLVSISKKTAALLQTMIADHRERGVFGVAPELVWPSGAHGKNELYRQHKEFLRRCGLTCDRYHMFHCFRRTTATQLTIASGIEQASKVLNHSSVAMTRRSYVDASQLAHVDATAFLPSPFPDDPVDDFPATIKFSRFA